MIFYPEEAAAGILSVLIAASSFPVLLKKGGLTSERAKEKKKIQI